MKTAELTDKIKHFIEQNFPRGIKIENETSLINNGIIDSMGIVEIIEYLESTFDIVVEDTEVDLKNFDTVLNIVKFIESKKSSIEVQS
jgi:acyl carrier protein